MPNSALACAGCGTRFFRYLTTTCHHCGALTSGAVMMTAVAREVVQANYERSKVTLDPDYNQAKADQDKTDLFG